MRSLRLDIGFALAATLALTLAAPLACCGCATYRQDLERARTHYEANEYEKALALFRVLEPDMDSLSEAEKTQFAYLRGMTDYRLAGLANAGAGINNPKQDFRSNARHWLGVASAIEKQTQGGLSTEEKQRLDDAMVDLNKDVYGGGDSVPDDGKGGDKAGDKSAKSAGKDVEKASDKPAARPEATKKP